MPETITALRTGPSSESVTHEERRAGVVPFSSRLPRRTPKPRRNLLRKRPRRRCVTRQAAFLKAYRKTASIAAAAKSAGIKPAQHYRWLAASAAYAERFTEVQEDITGRLQDAVVQLATAGQVEPVLYRGRACGTFQRPSPRLLLFYLEAVKPEEWTRLRSQELVGIEGNSCLM